MARKQDKLRPYRVDYFNIDEMKDNDLALVRSIVLRAVTAGEAAVRVLNDNAALPIVLIRSYRFYKQITHKKDVFKPVEDLFSEKHALIVMEEVEKYRAAQVPVVPDHAVPDPTAGVVAATFYKNNAGTQILQPDDNNGHVTRYSDSSLYDEVCVHCGATDTSGKLEDPCPVTVVKVAAAALGVDPQVLAAHAVEVTENLSGPLSPATVAAVADLRGMLAHDEHEQTMDKFVPDSVPAGKTFPANADMQTEVGGDGIISEELDAFHNVFPEPNAPMPGTPDFRGSGVAPTWQKILLFAGMLGGIMLLLWLILPHK